MRAGARSQAEALWDALIAAGAPCGLAPCGLGARDTLRLEMGYPLNGSDLSPERTPLQAGLGFFVDLNKGAFIGREVLAAEKAAGEYDRLVAIRMEAKGPPLRPHYAVCAGGGVDMLERLDATGMWGEPAAAIN